MKISQLLQSLKIDQNYDLKSKTKTTSVDTSESILESFKSKSSTVNQLASKYQVNLTEKEATSIDNFMKQTSGPLEDKLNTVEIAMYKGIELNDENLESIHTALTKDPDMEVDLLMPEAVTKDSGTLDSVIDNLKLPENIKAVLKRAIKEGASIEDAVKMVAKKILEALPDQYRASFEGVLSSGNVSELSDAMVNMVKNMTLSADQVTAILSINLNQSGISDGSISLQTDANRIQMLIDALSDNQGASVESGKGQEASIHLLETLLKALTGEDTEINFDDAVGDLVSKVNENQVLKAILLAFIKPKPDESGIVPDRGGFTDEPNVLSRDGNLQLTDGTGDASKDASLATLKSDASGIDQERLQSELSLGDLADLDEESILRALEQMLATITETNESILQSFDVKTFIIERVTEKSVALQAEFEAAKTELLNMTNPDQKPTSEMIEKAIQHLEKMIMKSEVSLYTDMATEKKLMVMSGQLSQAQKYLENGETQKALNLIKETHEQIQKIQVNMNPRKIQSFATERVKEAYDLLKPQEERTQAKASTIKDEITKLLDLQKDETGSRGERDILEVLRGLGLNHELETDESLASKSSEVKTNQINANIKEILLKLMKEDSNNRDIEETLMSLTGQQMMNDSGKQGQQRFHFFNLPFEDDLEINNMKVYMTGKNNGEVMDYKNAELYFGMNLKHLGETGIKISIKDEKVTLTLSNDQAETLSEAFASIEAEINAIGYDFDQTSLMAYKKDKPFTLNGEITATESFQYDAKKGFDFKI